MRMMRTSLGIGVAWLLLTGAASADHIYSYTFGQDTYAAALGATFNVDVFLQETVTGGDTSRLAAEGLVGAGVRVRFNIPPMPADPAEVLGTSDIRPNTAAFDDPLFLFTNLVPGSYAEFTEFVDVAGPPALATTVAPDTFRILLGSFRFTAGMVLGETTTIRAADVPGTDDTITATGLVLDPVIQPVEARIQVAAVPEPSTLTMLGTGALGLLGYAWRRRRNVCIDI